MKIDSGPSVFSRLPLTFIRNASHKFLLYYMEGLELLHLRVGVNEMNEMPALI